MGSGGGSMPAMPSFAATPRREPQVFSDIPQYELNRFELSRVGPNQFVDSRGNTRSGAEVKSLIASQPESAETRAQRQKGDGLSVEQPLATLAQVDTAAAAAAKKAEEDRARGRYGVKETSVTGPLGLSGPAPTRYATLLGA